MNRTKALISSLFLVAGALSMKAAIFANYDGTFAPASSSPAGQAYSTFTTNTSLLGDSVPSMTNSVGSVLFSTPLTYETTGLVNTTPYAWQYWSNGYAGYVLATSDTTTSLTITLPAGTTAFYFYVEPQAWSFQNFTVTVGGTSSSTVASLTGFGGAGEFEIYATDGDTLSTITISTVAASQGFAIGEFGISNATANTSAVPEPSTYGLLGAAGLVGAAFLRRRSRKA